MADKQQNGQDRENMTGAAENKPERITINTEVDPVYASLLQTDVEAAMHFVENGDFFSKTIESMTLTKEKLIEVFTSLQQAIISGADAEENITNWFSSFRESLQIVKPLLDELEQLRPYLEIEFEKPEYDGMTMGDLMEGSTDAEGNPIEDSLWHRALAAAREARAADEAAKNLPAVQYTRTHNVKMGVDKWSSVFFGFNAPDPKKDLPGQMSFTELKYEGDGEKEITLFYNYGFDDEVFSRFGLKKKIDDEDFFILTTIYNMYENGNTTVSATKLYKEMVGADPNTTQLEKFIQRLYKLTATTLVINDYEVQKAWHLLSDGENKGTYREVIAPLAPLAIGVEKYIANGKPVKAGIKILDRPYMMSLAQQIGQYTTVPKSVLFNKINKTERYYRVLHYTLKRVAQMKDPKKQTPNKILYSTFFDEIGETTQKGKSAAKKKLFEILEHFRTCDAQWIDGYREETTASTGEVGVRIFLPKPKLPKDK